VNLESVLAEWYISAVTARTMLSASVDHTLGMVSEHIAGWTSMMLKEVIYGLTDIGLNVSYLKFAYHSCIAPRHFAGEGLNDVTLRAAYFINQDIYIICRILIMYIVCWKSLAEKRRFLLSSLHSPPWAVQYIMAALWVIPPLEAPRSRYWKQIVLIT